MMVTIWYERGAVRPVGPNWHWYQATPYDLFAVQKRLECLADELLIADMPGSERHLGRRESGKLLLLDDAGGRPLDVDPDDVVFVFRREEGAEGSISEMQQDWLMGTCPTALQASFAALVVGQAIRFQMGMAMAGAQAQRVSVEAMAEQAMREHLAQQGVPTGLVLPPGTRRLNG